MANVATEFEEVMMHQGIDLARVDASMQRKFTRLVKDLKKQIIDDLQRIDPTGTAFKRYRQARAAKLFGLTDKTIQQSYNEAYRQLKDELVDLSYYEQDRTIQALNGTLNVELVNKTVDRRLLRAMVGDVPIRGQKLLSQWNWQGSKTKQAFRSVINNAVLVGEPMADIVRRIRGTRERRFKDGIFEASTREAKALIRTSIQTIANEARFMMYEENADIIKGVRWSSTLDTRTSDICKSLDGQAWTLDGRKLKGTVHNFIRPPVHWQCRSSLVPITKTWNELNQNPRIKKKLVESKQTRASIDGPVEGGLNYEQWLKGQSEEVQLRALGPSKLKLWKKGKLRFTDLIDQSHNPVTVEVLKTNSVDLRKTFVEEYGIPGNANSLSKAKKQATNLYQTKIQEKAQGKYLNKEFGQQIVDDKARLVLANTYLKEVNRLSKMNPNIAIDTRLLLHEPGGSSSIMGRALLRSSPIAGGAKPIAISTKLVKDPYLKVDKGWSGYDFSKKVETHLAYTIRHEFGHTLTTFAEERRLQSILRDIYKNDILRKDKGVWVNTISGEIFKTKTLAIKGMDEATLRIWVNRNISTYAMTNWKETIAESFAIYTAPGYKKGTLPNQIEELMEKIAQRPGKDEAITEAYKQLKDLNLSYIVLSPGEKFKLKGTYWDNLEIEDENITVIKGA